jgi:hypothetical protein
MYSPGWRRGPSLGLRVFPERTPGVPLLLRRPLPRNRLLHQREHPVRHEAGRPHDDPSLTASRARGTPPSDFAHFHGFPSHRRIHPAARPPRHHLVRTRRVPGVNGHPRTITLHGFNPPSAADGWDNRRPKALLLACPLMPSQVSHPALTIDRGERARPLRAPGRGNVSCGSSNGPGSGDGHGDDAPEA